MVLGIRRTGQTGRWWWEGSSDSAGTSVCPLSCAGGCQRNHGAGGPTALAQAWIHPGRAERAWEKMSLGTQRCRSASCPTAGVNGGTGDSGDSRDQRAAQAAVLSQRPEIMAARFRQQILHLCGFLFLLLRTPFSFSLHVVPFPVEANFSPSNLWVPNSAQEQN